MSTAITCRVKYAHAEVGYIDRLESSDPELDGKRVEQCAQAGAAIALLQRDIGGHDAGEQHERGKTLGLVGCGRIAREVAKRAAAFGYFSPEQQPGAFASEVPRGGLAEAAGSA